MNFTIRFAASTSLLFLIGCMSADPADILDQELAKYQHLPPFEISPYFERFRADELEKLVITYSSGASWSLTDENGLMYQPGPQYRDVFGKAEARLTSENSFCTEEGIYGKLFIEGEPKLRFNPQCNYLFGTASNLVVIRQSVDGSVSSRSATFSFE